MPAELAAHLERLIKADPLIAEMYFVNRRVFELLAIEAQRRLDATKEPAVH